MMAKFRPPDTETRITTALFDLCEHEFDFYSQVQPQMASHGVRVPKLVFGDFSRRNGAFIFLLEFIQADFYQVQDPKCTEDGRDEIIFRQLAKLHTIFWGGKQ